MRLPTLLLAPVLLLSLGAPHAPANPAPLVAEIPFARPPGPVELAQGSSVAPDGTTLSADSISLLENGRPLMPVAGEFHFSRYPREEWRTQLLRMRAGGITVVSTYVFWIHHEEERGRFDWGGGRDLRAFVSLCGELGLRAIVRIGPWNHGEVRNGGHPDWVEQAGTRKRSLDPAFLALVRPFYAQIAEQLTGLYWKNGGPIVAVQVENECDDPGYLLELKRMARELGIDAPWYTMTGWNGVRIPEQGLLPLFGAYSVAFWYPHSRDTWKKSFFFTSIRDDGDMGAQFTNTRPHRAPTMNGFPYLCCEIGGGMPSSYTKRVKVDAREISAMSLVKLGNGSNMPGYYMYQGGINPEGRLSQLHEAAPNSMPVKDYDFQAPLGLAGLARPQAHLLRRQHLFIAAHGPELARMPLVLPAAVPTSIQDTDTVRWALRDNGRSGFLFLNNHQPLLPLPARRGVQFLLRRPAGEQLVPAEPLDIPPGTHGILPLNLSVGGLTLRYATVDALGSLSHGGDQWFLFGEIEGLRPELAIDAAELPRLQPAQEGARLSADGSLALVPLRPSLAAALSLPSPGGGRVHLVVLPSREAGRLHRVTLRGAPAFALSPATLHADGDRLVLEDTDAARLTLSVFSPALQPPAAPRQGPSPAPLFRPVPLGSFEAGPRPVTVTSVRTADLGGTPLDGRREEDWERAPEWFLDLPAPLGNGARELLRLRYQGEAARLYVDGKLYLDNTYNGDPMEIPLWRLPAGSLGSLRLRVIPFAPDARTRLPAAQAAEILPGSPASASGQLVPVHHAEARF